MPLYDKRCLNDHTVTIYAHTPVERYVRTVICPVCGQTMATTVSFGARPLTYMRESRPMLVTNMGHEPVYLTSPQHHRDEMRKRGLTHPGVGYGNKGTWV